MESNSFCRIDSIRRIGNHLNRKEIIPQKIENSPVSLRTKSITFPSFITVWRLLFFCANQVICLYYCTNRDIKTIQERKFLFIPHSFSIDNFISVQETCFSSRRFKTCNFFTSRFKYKLFFPQQERSF